MPKEATARIKINNILQDAGWRFFDDDKGKANVHLELHVKTSKTKLDEFGDDFEKTTSGFVDFLLSDQKGFPVCVLEAKSETKNPLIGKEQARKYAESLKVRFIILSNGNLSYFWDTEKASPNIITRFPTPTSLESFKNYKPNPTKLIDEVIEWDYIAKSQLPDYCDYPEWNYEPHRNNFIKKHGLRFLRKYQVKAVQAIQNAVKIGKERYLLEMATGTGKTLVAGAVIKLFLKTSNASRVLFLVDRLELETQAWKWFVKYLKNDYKTVIYKENREDWRKAEIVVTTIQSLLSGGKYKTLFSPTDFDLVISDEAHRTIGGNSRAVFEYFIGYKLGLTATPKDYLKNIKNINEKDPREIERRLLLDSYKTFGCETGVPTFRYSLIDGVKDDFLINPIVVDARTEITTQMLSTQGYSIMVMNDDTGEQSELFFNQKDYEKRFYSDYTNKVFCKAFLENALRDPVSGEIGKTIIFCVSQNHAAKIAQVLNEFTDRLFPGKYKSDFAIQVTSLIPDAQQYTINFANNALSGKSHWLEGYLTGKTRICVTVGMMTTGYDCEDILNLCMMRPIFSPTDFIQIKGRGTRKFNFADNILDNNLKTEHKETITDKERFKLFDFFGNCEYFEEKFNYDEVIKLPPRPKKYGKPTPNDPVEEHPQFDPLEYENIYPDPIKTLKIDPIGLEGMKIDRMFYKFEQDIKQDTFIKANIEQDNWDAILGYVVSHYFDKPEEFYNLEKLNKGANIDRKITLREMIEKIFGLIPYFKSKDELIEDEFQKFVSISKPQDEANIMALKYFFKAYISDPEVRKIIDEKRYADLNVCPTFNMDDFKAVGKDWRDLIPDYVKAYISLNKFMV